MKRRWLILFLIILVGFFAYNYLNKDHRDVAKEEAVVILEASDFYSSFQLNQQEFNTKYLDKALVLKGTITTKEVNGVVINLNCYITFKDSSYKSLKINEHVSIKGRYVGYDDLLEQLKIDQAIILSNIE